MKNYIAILCFLLFGMQVFAAGDEVTFTADAPQSVVAGQRFRVTYQINQDSKDFFAPDMSDFDVLMGPSTSRSTSMQITNGSYSSSTIISYTYMLVGREPGTYTLAPAEITIKGKRYSSNSLEIRVLPPDENTTSSSQSQQQ